MSKAAPMTDCIAVVTTTASRDEALRLAHALVERQLAACVQVVGPIESVYRWQGAVEQAAEWQCWIKTVRGNFAPVEEAIRSLHSYEVPEILAVPIVAGSADYLTWLCRETIVAQPGA
jgi:periplasmic divalent cation tolerance protein